MLFFHGTSKESWDAILKEGVLWGRRFVVDSNGNKVKEVDRCTYLSTDAEEAERYGEIILLVEYNPFEHPKENNYCEGCWQVRVYEPISINKITKLW